MKLTEVGGYTFYHSVRDDWHSLIDEFVSGDGRAIAALGPVYDNDPARETLAPFYRSLDEVGITSAVSDETLAPEQTMKKVRDLRIAEVNWWTDNYLDQDFRDAVDWTRAGLVLEIASGLGIPLKEGSKAHVKWKMRGTVTGRFGVEPGGFNPLVIPRDQRDRIIPSEKGRSIFVLDFRAMDLCSILSIHSGIRSRYDGANDLHARTAEITGLDRDVAKRELFVYTYGGRSPHHELFEQRIPELKMFRGSNHMEASANAQLIQSRSALAFRAGLSRTLPKFFGSNIRPLFAVHDELTLDALSDDEFGVRSVADALEEGASERMGVPYSVGMSFGRTYAEAKE